MILQERMRALRRERGETQVQTAKAVGVTDRQYHLDHFGVSLDYLAGRTDVRQVAKDEYAEPGY